MTAAPCLLVWGTGMGDRNIRASQVKGGLVASSVHASAAADRCNACICVIQLKASFVNQMTGTIAHCVAVTGAYCLRYYTACQERAPFLPSACTNTRRRGRPGSNFWFTRRQTIRLDLDPSCGYAMIAALRLGGLAPEKAWPKTCNCSTYMVQMLPLRVCSKAPILVTSKSITTFATMQWPMLVRNGGWGLTYALRIDAQNMVTGGCSSPASVL